jgi:hypothetical protein
MDIVRALRELYHEKKRLDAAIAALEARRKAGLADALKKPGQGRRGRKSMSAEERLAVSRRMTLYWETRRAKLHAPPQTAPATSEEQQASSTSAS